MRRPEAAELFFIPFYSRLAYADKSARPRVRNLQINATRTLRSCLRESPWHRRQHGRDHVAAISSTRDPKKLFGDAWPLVRNRLDEGMSRYVTRYVTVRNRLGEGASVNTGTTPRMTSALHGLSAA